LKHIRDWILSQLVTPQEDMPQEIWPIYTFCHHLCYNPAQENRQLDDISHTHHLEEFFPHLSGSQTTYLTSGFPEHGYGYNQETFVAAACIAPSVF
jgi:hypothetical protein